MTKAEQIFKLIEAGYSKAEIDVLMNDAEVNNNTKVEPSDNSDVNKAKSTNENGNATETKKEETAPTVNDTVSNTVLLTAINNLTKAIQENNRNTTTSDGNINGASESVSDILSKCLK